MKRDMPWIICRLMVLAIGLGAVTCTTSAATILDAGLTYSYDDNLSNGQLTGDIKGDHLIDLELSGGRYIQLDSSLGLIGIAKLKATRYDTYTGINSTNLGVSASLQKKFGLGPMAPLLSASMEVSHLDARHDPRDRWIYKAGLGIRKRVNERLDLSLDYEHLQTNPDDRGEDIPFLVDNFGIGGDVFRIRRNSLTASLIFSVTERLSSYGSFSRQRGTIVASTVPDPALVSIYDKAMFDPVFGPGVVAYAIEADTNIFGAGLSWALNNHSALNLGYERRESKGGLNFKYANNILRASLLYAF